MEYDAHSHMKVFNAVPITAISGNGTTNGNVIDTVDFESMEYVVKSGTITDGTYTLVLEESDEVTFGGEETAVPADQILGAAVDFVAADDNAIRRLGVIGKKRYQRLSIVAAGVTTGGTLSADAMLGYPRQAPVPDQST